MTRPVTLPRPDHTIPASSIDLNTCDRCGALGVVRWVLANGLDLVFCGHHNRTAKIGATVALRRVDVLHR